MGQPPFGRWVALVVTCACGFEPACGFPDVTFHDDSDGAIERVPNADAAVVVSGGPGQSGETSGTAAGWRLGSPDGAADGPFVAQDVDAGGAAFGGSGLSGNGGLSGTPATSGTTTSGSRAASGTATGAATGAAGSGLGTTGTTGTAGTTGSPRSSGNASGGSGAASGALATSGAQAEAGAGDATTQDAGGASGTSGASGSSGSAGVSGSPVSGSASGASGSPVCTCSGGQAPLPTGVDCVTIVISALLPFGQAKQFCRQTQGFVLPALACGAQGTYVTCDAVKDVPVCQVASQTTMTQQCQ